MTQYRAENRRLMALRESIDQAINLMAVRTLEHACVGDNADEFNGGFAALFA